jgi:hypothetical protein
MQVPPPDSLVALAARKQLPDHQLMDAATVEWIARNRPGFPATRLAVASCPKLRPSSRHLLAAAGIPAAWFAVPALAESIHGVRHGMRTAAYAALLGELVELDDEAAAALIIAAAVHDCRRLHDKDDIGHGARAARWLATHTVPVAKHFAVSAEVLRQLWQARIAVRLHDLPYERFRPAQVRAYQQVRQLSDLLKAADALDRYRLPKLKWWPDTQRVRVEAFGALLRFAYELVLETERAWVHDGAHRPASAAGSAALVAGALAARGLL